MTTDQQPPARIPAGAGEMYFERGRSTLRTGGIDAQETARSLFHEAVRAAGSPMLWRVAEATVDIPDQAAYWMSRAVLSESEPGGMTVDPNCLGILGGTDGDPLVQNWSIAVRSEDRERALAALTTAAETRLWAVFEDGREVPADEAEDFFCDTDLYNPNHIGIDGTTTSVWMDCKGGIMPLMARTMLRIVRDELRKAGVRTAHLHSPAPATPG
ncbi:hypothetical protein ACFXI0_06710 [Kitasatospora indigofera]|uniref:hypothetical protein n=1 Tax=Kitasatospora indigofera TaxID=67307 RepID=UPI0036B4BB06